MRPEALLASLLLVSNTLIVQAGNDAPYFSPEETEYIADDEILAGMVPENPWVVRRVLDALTSQRLSERSPGTDANVARPRGLASRPGFDAGGIGHVAEDSPAWIALFRQALGARELGAPEIAKRNQPTSPDSGRSAEASVEIIEMMKRARAVKESKVAK